jgi:hypothetical protein
VSDDKDKGVWTYDGYSTDVRDGMQGDDAKNCPLDALRLGVQNGNWWLELDGGFSDAHPHPVEIMLTPDPVSTEDDDPICANCGVYRSEHQGMGCSYFSREPSFVISGEDVADYLASRDSYDPF